MHVHVALMPVVLAPLALHMLFAAIVTPFGRSLRLVLGTTVDSGEQVILRDREAGAHQHVMGVTGAGKSKLLASLFVQLLNQGVGVGLLDPHGDLCRDILRTLHDLGYFADSRAFRRLLYVDFGRSDRFLPWNVLDQPYGPHQVARNLLEAIKRAWVALAGGSAVHLENLVLAGVYVLVENHLPLTALSHLLADAAFRARLLEQVTDAEVVAFFRDRYDALGRRAAMLNESTLRRAFLLGFTPALRYSLGQRTNRLRLRPLMDAGVSILVNLGGLDPDTQRLLGCLFTVEAEAAALSRADMPEQARRPWHLILDEFSQFSAQSEQTLERVLALTRKYGLSLTLAHQTWSQVGRKLQGALQNTTFIAFRLGPEDSAWAAPRLFEPDPYRIKHQVSDPYQQTRSHPVYMSASEQRAEFEQALQHLQPREAFARVGGRTVKLRTLLLPEPHCSAEELAAIEEGYAELLLTPRAQVEAEMLAAVEMAQTRRPAPDVGLNADEAVSCHDQPARTAGDRRPSHPDRRTAHRRVSPLPHEVE